MRGHVLIVEPERDLQRALGNALAQADFAVTSAQDGETAMGEARKGGLDLILLELVLPDMPGTEVCRQLKHHLETAEVPVVMMSANGEEADRVVAFELGVDDYVLKPFSVRELVLRVQAVLRRARRAAGAAERVTFGKLEVDRAAHRVWVQGEEVTLTALELRFLMMLYDQRGRVLSRDVLHGEVWGTSVDMSARNVDTSVRRVRDKLGAAGEYVETVRGVGYRFCAEPP